MAKTTNLYIRIEPKLKEQAELVLKQLGIPVSNAVNMFLKQVVMQRGIPFDVKLPATKPVGTAGLTEKELNAELEEGYADFVQGNTKSAEKTFSDIRKDYEI
ncbi:MULTISPECIES: type II toxin-antitoxin system RelB/DinJ family antitoxin [Tissierellales]|jgi:DNA-damage-inducible protein J|uniref:Type II toxin-antitoxin system RelB/DinJ family antitoxin n=1 Tax=Acidilutibacter cellobiosedens TaxID=2507161 RepID=A0A410QH14_9FIRM|nr:MULTISPECIES: type II toxin-antitoxin system RelB/DinJ family antitoxin [Tissierellales]QAT63134.1 type II toxin-antitoxin system RelB/DinJ family antitoxin [Acidilutibacter cellobiosedens]SCL86153.1 addiction module antitoxin, RelB/DinJ family [Sporanaerobacter sp. PP17-6a]